MSYLPIQADARYIPLADGIVQCCVTSPPYFALRDYGTERQIGLESTPGEYVAAMVGVFREVRRILRDDGTVWLNLGDSYANDTKWGGGGGNPTSKNYTSGLGGCVGQKAKRNTGLKPKDLMGIPWRVAFALQEDGWYLRSEIIWFKRNPMPESVTDRPGKAHEQIFLLTKSPEYFYDVAAVREDGSDNPITVSRKGRADNGAVGTSAMWGDGFGQSGKGGNEDIRARAGRNLRTVWDIPVNGFPGAHFATFPHRLPEICIKAGTSEKGCCPKCRSPWVRVIEKERIPTRPGLISKVYEEPPVHPDSPLRSHAGIVCGNRDPARHCTATKTVGWEPSCRCDAGDPVPCIVFDPFGGAFTTASVADGLGRAGIGTELNREYCEMGLRRLSRPHAPIGRPQREEILPLFG